MMISKRVFAVGLGVLATGAAASATDLTGPMIFVATAPCRIIDTRTGSGFTGAYGAPALVPAAVRTFQITGTTTGTPAQCGIPDTAVAISANFTATGFTGGGDLRVFQAGAAAPLVSILNFQLESIANAANVPLGPSGSGHNGISVRADVASTQLIVDVNGYFFPLPSVGAPALLTQVCGTNDVSFGGHCYYLDGSKGVCDPGYQVASQSILNTIAASFVGLNYKHTISGNCCVFNADPTENWGMANHCNVAGPFTAGDPALGAAGCTAAVVNNPNQLTLCGK